ncbi:MAG: response regulator [Defluviitaleaceae bacterium]|nr:response regulator [Defluviitaleaceae bacterium]
MDKQKVFIIDDADIARVMLKNILNETGDVEIMGEEKTGMGAIIMLEELKPDIVFLEADIGGDMKLDDVISEMRKVDKDVKIIVCADDLSQYKAVEASLVGADEIVGKPYRKRTIQRIVKSYKEGV